MEHILKIILGLFCILIIVFFIKGKVKWATFLSLITFSVYPLTLGLIFIYALPKNIINGKVIAELPMGIALILIIFSIFSLKARPNLSNVHHNQPSKIRWVFLLSGIAIYFFGLMITLLYFYAPKVVGHTTPMPHYGVITNVTFSFVSSLLLYLASKQESISRPNLFRKISSLIICLIISPSTWIISLILLYSFPIKPSTSYPTLAGLNMLCYLFFGMIFILMRREYVIVDTREGESANIEMNGINEANHIEDQQSLPHDEYRIISGFWRRFLAFIIDTIILGLTGIVIGYFFFDQLTGLGCWGNLLGFFIALPYFCLLNSAMGKGQTIGKKIVKIEVVDQYGKNIPVNISFLRYTILYLPYFLSGDILPPSFSLLYIISFISSVFIGAIIYLYIFNRRTRQSVHDLFVGTFVVKTIPQGKVKAVPIWKPHVAIGFTWLIVVLILFPILINYFQKGIYTQMLAIQQSIQSSGYVQKTNVSASISTDKNNSFLIINAFWKKQPDDFEESANKIAAIILKDYPAVMDKNNLIINISYGYDIGIARAWKSKTFNHSPQEWKNALQLLPEKK